MTCVICPKLKDCYIVFLDFNLPEDYLIEEDPLVNKFISAKEGVNCAAFIGGVVEAFLRGTGFVSYVNILYTQYLRPHDLIHLIPPAFLCYYHH
jgi:hypothetical protein